MKTILAAFVAAILLPAVAGADHPSPGDFWKKTVEKYDKDKDGKISDAEKAVARKEWEAKHADWRKQNAERYEEMKKKLLEKYDTDKDGKIGDAERKAMMESWRKQRTTRMEEYRKKAAADRQDLPVPSDATAGLSPPRWRTTPAELNSAAARAGP